jgi:hypothetical protein
MWQGWFDAGASTMMVARCLMIIHFLDHTLRGVTDPHLQVLLEDSLPCATALLSCLPSTARSNRADKT